MISLDFKYTSLYWALGFREFKLDRYIKEFNAGARIEIEAEDQRVHYFLGHDSKPLTRGLARHKDFVILECVDRLLRIGYPPESIVIADQRESVKEDIVVIDTNDRIFMAIRCEQWGRPYFAAVEGYRGIRHSNPTGHEVVFTSRLVSGLIEFKCKIAQEGAQLGYDHGLLEDDSVPYRADLRHRRPSLAYSSPEFQIDEDELVRYLGRAIHAIVPDGIRSIGASAFWNCTSIESVSMPEGLERIGGDSFYCCSNLKTVNIPASVRTMGNDPFAGCQKLKVKNSSPNFIDRSGVLYSQNMTKLIHYPAIRRESVFDIPEEVEIVGKHAFFACRFLEKVTIPEAVQHLENNPFSGCVNLEVINRSPKYHFDDGVIYNGARTVLVGCLPKFEIPFLEIPDTVEAIGRNAFWNCKKISTVVLTHNIRRIGYNPFAGCENLVILNQNPHFKLVDGVLYSESLRELLCCPNLAAQSGFAMPDSLREIGRSAFSGCSLLTRIDLPDGLEVIEKSAFTNCTSLEEISLPDSVASVGEWAFAYCSNLKRVKLSEKTKFELNTFNECPVTLEYR
jgi:hypothetical protein